MRHTSRLAVASLLVAAINATSQFAHRSWFILFYTSTDTLFTLTPLCVDFFENIIVVDVRSVSLNLRILLNTVVLLRWDIKSKLFNFMVPT